MITDIKGDYEYTKGRGESLPQSKLTESDVKLILKLVDERESLKKQASDLSNKKLAEKFDVHQRTIEKLLSGKTWRHVC